MCAAAPTTVPTFPVGRDQIDRSRPTGVERSGLGVVSDRGGSLQRLFVHRGTLGTRDQSRPRVGVFYVPVVVIFGFLVLERGLHLPSLRTQLSVAVLDAEIGLAAAVTKHEFEHQAFAMLAPGASRSIDGAKRPVGAGEVIAARTTRMGACP